MSIEYLKKFQELYYYQNVKWAWNGTPVEIRCEGHQGLGMDRTIPTKLDT